MDEIICTRKTHGPKMPTVAGLKKSAEKYGMDRVMILYTTPKGILGYTSYGWNKKYCEQMHKLGEQCISLAKNKLK